MSFAGIPCTTILKIENNTGEVISYIDFIYNSDEISTKVKNIKPNENKQTGVRTLYDVRDLKMIINGVDKEYLIKSEIPQGYSNTITIVINSINSDNCEFDIQEGE
ncbi:hypothetical protein [Faecalimicrobium dakarense]|uniref:hypothetical protein n=1 Tax=Faecalimicrobium dakarense TaxID=1301100 RepID=UPI0004B0F575|nr:hypothetical protein [[Clostridium] dakarense]